MLINTPRTRLGALIDAFLTVLGWLAFVYLFGIGIVGILRAGGEGPDVAVASRFLPTLGTLSVYVLVAMFNAAVLIMWALYNYFRFAGLDRRRPLPAVTAEQLAHSFEISEKEIHQLRAARVAVLRHRPDGKIENILLSQPDP